MAWFEVIWEWDEDTCGEPGKIRPGGIRFVHGLYLLQR